MIDESTRNILEALYEASSTIKTYVDMVSEGNALPFTILIADKEAEDNRMKLLKIEDYLNDDENTEWNNENTRNIRFNLKEIINTKKPEVKSQSWEVCMYLDGQPVDGTKQIVHSREEIDKLTQFAMFKGYVLYTKELV